MADSSLCAGTLRRIHVTLLYPCTMLVIGNGIYRSMVTLLPYWAAVTCGLMGALGFPAVWRKRP